MEIQEKELRIRELQAEVTSKQIDAQPPDVLRPDNLKNEKFSSFICNCWHERVEWKKLGATLGFTNQELEELDEFYRKSEMVEPSFFRLKDQLKELFSRWLQRYPGDSRGSTCFATYTQLQTALLNAGYGDIACDLPTFQELTFK